MDKTQGESKFLAFIKKLVPKKAVSLTAKKARMGWLFVLPFVIGLLVFYIGVIAESIGYSFATYAKIPASRGGGYSLSWVGMENYKNVLTKTVDTKTGETFLEMMFTGFGKQIVEVVAIIMLSLFIAILLNQKMVGRAAFRAIFFVPVVVGAGIIAKIDYDNALLKSMSSMESIDMGSVGGGGMGDLVDAMDITALFENLGIGTSLVKWVTDLISNIYDIVNRSGVQMLIFLAGLQSISPAIYESCSIDGATEWETFWKITFPMISPMILVNGVYTIIDSFTTDSNVVMKYIKNAYSKGEEISTAMSWIYFLIVILIVALGAAIFSAFVFYQRRD